MYPHLSQHLVLLLYLKRYKSGRLSFIISNVPFWYVRKIEDFLTVDPNN